MSVFSLPVFYTEFVQLISNAVFSSLLCPLSLSLSLSVSVARSFLNKLRQYTVNFSVIVTACYQAFEAKDIKCEFAEGKIKEQKHALGYELRAV